MDETQYGFRLWLISLAIVCVLGCMVLHNMVGFSKGITETAIEGMKFGAYDFLIKP